MSDKEFDLFKLYKDKLTPDEQLHKLIHDEDFQEKELAYRRRLIDEYFNKIVDIK